jgi:hypothetical protein
MYQIGGDSRTWIPTIIILLCYHGLHRYHAGILLNKEVQNIG